MFSRKYETHTKFLKLLKNANYRKKNFKTCWKKYLQMYRSIHFCTVKEKNEYIYIHIYNTADQVVDMQAVNFVLMKHN